MGRKCHYTSTVLFLSCTFTFNEVAVGAGMVAFFLIRHGESKDNLGRAWAGWRDSPLTNHGMRQAEALADDFRRMNLSFSAIYTSDLLRAKLTADAVQQKQQGSSETPTPSIQEVELLREMHFGAGEGRGISRMEKGLSMEAHYAKGKFPVMQTREQKFPGGESFNDVAQRAETVIEDIIVKEMIKERQEGRGRTVAIFSHGIFIKELIAAILRKDENHRLTSIRFFRGMKNTGWTRLDVTRKVTSDGDQLSEDSASCSWAVIVNGIGQHGHLSNLHRQKGGIGSMTHDPSQQNIREFLGGKQNPKKTSKKSLTKAKPY